MRGSCGGKVRRSPVRKKNCEGNPGARSVRGRTSAQLWKVHFPHKIYEKVVDDTHTHKDINYYFFFERCR